MQYALNQHSDKGQLEGRLKELCKNRHKAILEKDRRIAEADRLDILDPMYEMKYADCEKRLTAAYVKIEGIDHDIQDVETDLTTQLEAEATKRDAHEALMQITESGIHGRAQKRSVWFRRGSRNYICSPNSRRMVFGYSA